MEPRKYAFQDPVSPIAEGIVDIHHHVFFFLVIIFIFVCWILYRIVIEFSCKIPERRFYYDDYYEQVTFLARPMFDPCVWYFQDLMRLKLLTRLRFLHNTTIEVVWTFIPSSILYLIAVPSFLLLYSMDEIIDPAITLKAVGHQWYWSYEYSDYKIDFDTINFDSYMLPEDELELGQMRLLEVDNPIVLPVNTHVRLIVTAADVLHCWTIPSLGVKIDAVPGRLNQASIFIKKLGIFYGQCSEICGVNHGFMPIVLKSVRLNNYIDWIVNKLEE